MELILRKVLSMYWLPTKKKKKKNCGKSTNQSIPWIVITTHEDNFLILKCPHSVLLMLILSYVFSWLSRVTNPTRSPPNLLDMSYLTLNFRGLGSPILSKITLMPLTCPCLFNFKLHAWPPSVELYQVLEFFSLHLQPFFGQGGYTKW